MMGVIVSVNVGLPQNVAWQGRTVRTAVWKTPVTGRVVARRLKPPSGSTCSGCCCEILGDERLSLLPRVRSNVDLEILPCQSVVCPVRE